MGSVSFKPSHSSLQLLCIWEEKRVEKIFSLKSKLQAVVIFPFFCFHLKTSLEMLKNVLLYRPYLHLFCFMVGPGASTFAFAAGNLPKEPAVSIELVTTVPTFFFPKQS